MLVDHLAPATRRRYRTIDGRHSVQHAARAFADPEIGLLVVCGGDGQLQGVVSKSDLVGHLARAGAASVAIERVMTRAVATIAGEADLAATWALMAARRLQNLPVLAADRRPVGTLDARDALQALLEAERQQEEQLVRYIDGVGYR